MLEDYIFSHYSPLPYQSKKKKNPPKQTHNKIKQKLTVVVVVVIKFRVESKGMGEADGELKFASWKGLSSARALSMARSAFVCSSSSWSLLISSILFLSLFGMLTKLGAEGMIFFWTVVGLGLDATPFSTRITFTSDSASWCFSTFLTSCLEVAKNQHHRNLLRK
jgi:hypothetical protein